MAAAASTLDNPLLLLILMPCCSVAASAAPSVAAVDAPCTCFCWCKCCWVCWDEILVCYPLTKLLQLVPMLCRCWCGFSSCQCRSCSSSSCCVHARVLSYTRYILCIPDCLTPPATHPPSHPSIIYWTMRNERSVCRYSTTSGRLIG